MVIYILKTFLIILGNVTKHSLYIFDTVTTAIQLGVDSMIVGIEETFDLSS